MKKINLVIISILFLQSTYSLPINWHGEMLFDLQNIKSYRYIESDIDNSTSGSDDEKNGSQEIGLSHGKSTANFGTYIFKLQPEIIVNDSTTIRAEFTTGYSKGGVLSEDSTRNKGPQSVVSLYTYNTISSSPINLTQAYVTFYADLATYKIGKHTTNWGLGAIHSSGEKNKSRHSSTREGITVDFKVGNLKLSPYYSKISQGDSLTKKSSSSEAGISALYDNKAKNILFGLLYAQKSNSSNGEDESEISEVSLGKADVNITDIYFKKSTRNYSLELDIPIISGSAGKVFNSTDDAKYKAYAILIHNKYKLNSRHIFGLNIGLVSGEDNDTSSFNALYLHPNYQIANILFRYNLAAISDRDLSIYDSNITNTFFLKFLHSYNSGEWYWENSIIFAQANKVAEASKNAFNHTKLKSFAASYSQKKDLGIEIDSNLTYQWNTNVSIGGSFGYLFVGDYFAYTNSATVNEVKNALSFTLFSNVKF